MKNIYKQEFEWLRAGHWKFRDYARMRGSDLERIAELEAGVERLEAERDRLAEALHRADDDLSSAGRDYDGDLRVHFNRTTHAHARIRAALAELEETR